MLRRMNEALPGLVVTILLYGLVIELAGVWFVEDKMKYSIGLWYGVAIAVGLAINLAMVIFGSTSAEQRANLVEDCLTGCDLPFFGEIPSGAESLSARHNCHLYKRVCVLKVPTDSGVSGFVASN